MLPESPVTGLCRAGQGQMVISGPRAIATRINDRAVLLN